MQEQSNQVPQPTNVPPQTTNEPVEAQSAVQSPSYPQNPPPKKGGLLKKVLLIFVSIVIIGGIVGLGGFIFNQIRNRANSDQPIELTWWGLWEDSSIVEPIIAQYQQANPNITIKYQRQSPEDYRERLSNVLAQGNGPDIYRIHNTWIPMFRNELEPLPNEVMSQEEYESVFYRVAIESALTEEGIMAIPLEFDALGLFINEEIFSTFAQTVPDTWDELRETAKELTVRDNLTSLLSQPGIAMGDISNVDYWENIMGLLLIQNRASLTEPMGTGAVGAFRFFEQFVTTDQVWDSAQANSIDAFATGKVAMIFAPAKEAFNIADKNPGLDFRVVPVPQLAKTTQSDPDVTYASFWMEGVASDSKKTDEAWKFLKYLTEQENLRKLYQNASNSRDAIPELYPRVDMRNELISDPHVGGVIRFAEGARFWYLAGNTNDGDTGLNSQLASLYEQKFNEEGFRRFEEMEAFARSVRTVLARYRLATPPPPLEEE